MTSNEPNSLRLHLDRPSAARIYDYILDHDSPNNYAIDRNFAEQHVLTVPDVQKAVRENRRFVARAVETALEHGVRQFIDLGAGLPSKGQPHEVADRIAPEVEARVIYVDNEVIANAHSHVLLAEHADPDRHQALLGDYFNHGDLWNRIKTSEIIDPKEPVCLILAALLHFMPDEYRPDIPLGFYLNKLAPGSMMALSHGSQEDKDDDRLTDTIDNYKKTTATVNLRSTEEIQAFFGDWEMLDPGVVWCGEWRPKANRSEEPWWDDDNRGSVGGKPWWGNDKGRMLVKAGMAIKR